MNGSSVCRLDNTDIGISCMRRDVIDDLSCNINSAFHFIAVDVVIVKSYSRIDYAGSRVVVNHDINNACPVISLCVNTAGAIINFEFLTAVC